MHAEQDPAPPRRQGRAVRLPRATGDGPWFWCSQDAADYAIEVSGSVGFALYLGLCRRQARAGGREEFHASATNLASATGLGVRTVEKYLRKLEGAGLIATRSGRHAGPSGAHSANVYFLPAPPSARRAEASAPDYGMKCGQIEGSLQSKEEPSAATRAGRPIGLPPAGGEEEEKPERPWL